MCDLSFLTGLLNLNFYKFEAGICELQFMSQAKSTHVGNSTSAKMGNVSGENWPMY